MSYDAGGGSFQVVPDSLIAASDRAARLAADVAGARDGFGQSMGGADASLSEVSAGDGWNAFTTAWRAALGRLANSQETFAYNTEAAAVRYEDADHRSMQEFAPPVIPSPEDIHRAWEEACEPGMLGDIPEECLLA